MDKPMKEGEPQQPSANASSLASPLESYCRTRSSLLASLPDMPDQAPLAPVSPEPDDPSLPAQVEKEERPAGASSPLAAAAAVTDLQAPAATVRFGDRRTNPC